MTSRKSEAKAAEFIQEGYKFNYNITGRNLTVTEAMKNYIMEKFTKLERYNVRIIDVVVVLDIQKLRHRVDIMLKGNNILIKSQADTEDMYASIDQAIDKLQNQIRRYHSKITDHQTRGGSVIDMAINVYKGPKEEELEEINSEIEEENKRRLAKSFDANAVVKTDQMPIKTLTLDEALVKIELSGDPFLIFRGEEDQRMKVIYKREDGTVGVGEIPR